MDIDAQQTYFDEYDGSAGGLRKDRDINRGIDKGNPTEFMRDEIEEGHSSATFESFEGSEGMDLWPEIEEAIKDGATAAEEENNSSAHRETQFGEGSTTVNGRKVDRKGLKDWLESVGPSKWGIGKSYSQLAHETRVRSSKGGVSISTGGFSKRIKVGGIVRYDDLYFQRPWSSSNPYGSPASNDYARAYCEGLSSASFGGSNASGSKRAETRRESDSGISGGRWLSPRELIDDLFFFPEGHYGCGYDICPKNTTRTWVERNGVVVTSTHHRTYKGSQSAVIGGYDLDGGLIDVPPRIIIDDSMEKSCCQMIARIYDVINPDQYPGEMPSTMLNDDPDPKTINSLTDLLLHKFRLWDEATGQYPVKIKIPDADRTQEGEQSLDLKFPNQAELLAEIYGLVMNQSVDNDLYEDYLARIITEIGLTRISARQAYDALKEILDWLGVDWEKREGKMQMTFTPGEEMAEKVLQNSTQPYQQPHIKEGEQSLKEILQQLLNAAAIIRSVHFRPVDRKGDVKGQIINNLKRGIDLYDKLSNIESKSDDGQSWEKFKEMVQANFSTPGDTQKSDNPLIKDFKPGSVPGSSPKPKSQP
ncbi:MAG: hypothetical protein ACRC8A_16970 [Microcoleaceae cyanobacterium]